MSDAAVRAPRAANVTLFLLFLLNLLNFFDRTLPAVIAEPVRREFSLSDLQLGVIGSAFTLVYAIAGVPLGRLADKTSRKTILSISLVLWSAFTAATAFTSNFASFFIVRMAVGVGEAGCAPAATSMIGDLFPSERRARAMGRFMLGLPLGLVAAFFGGGLLVKAFGGWRTPFLVAGAPGLVLVLILAFMPEPTRGAADGVSAASLPVERPVRTILSIPTMRWMILSGLSVNFAAYAGNSFLVVLLQRYFDLPIEGAASRTGVIVGLTGLVGLTVGGTVADRIRTRSPRGRLVYGAISLVASAPLTYFALEQGRDGVAEFTLLFGFGWLLYYAYYTTVYSALQDVIEPRLRATAMALYFVGMYVLGGAAGPIVVGALSDRYSHAAMIASHATEMTAEFKAIGLHDAMKIIPAMLFFTGIFVFCASRTFEADAARMQKGLSN